MFTILLISIIDSKAQVTIKPSPKDRIDKIAEDIGIEKVKAVSLVKVLDQYQKSMSQLMKDDKMAEKEKQERLKLMVQEQQKAISAILSKEEQEKMKLLLNQKYEQKRKKRQEDMLKKNSGKKN
jgi:hypothetical protein